MDRLIRSSWVSVVLAMLLSACEPSPASPDAGRTVDRDATVACGTAGSSGPGGRCECGTECVTDALCLSEAEHGFAGGYCVVTCTLGDPSACAPGLACVGIEGAAALCAPECTTALDCAPGRICDGSSTRACAPYCDQDSDCTSGHCHLLSGRCNDGSDVPGAGLDEACTRPEDCASANCYAGRCATICSVADPHCPVGALCSSPFSFDIGFCHFACREDETCAMAGTSCVTPAYPPDIRICSPTDGCFGRGDENTDGRQCGCDADCDPGSSCVRETTFPIPHGACLRDCTVDPLVCEGDVCGIVRSAGLDACHAPCSTSADCGIGRVCASGGVCEPLCSADADCLGRHCNHYTGYCDTSATTDLPNDVPCGASGDCRSGLCYTAAMGGERTCTSFCSVPAQVCPDGGICAPFDRGRDFGLCARPCTADGDCPRGQTCDDAGVPGMTLMACLGW